LYLGMWSLVIGHQFYGDQLYSIFGIDTLIVYYYF